MVIVERKPGTTWTEAIQHAILRAAAKGGDVVILPPGIYECTLPFPLPKGVRLESYDPEKHGDAYEVALQATKP